MDVVVAGLVVLFRWIESKRPCEAHAVHVLTVAILDRFQPGLCTRCHVYIYLL